MERQGKVELPSLGVCWGTAFPGSQRRALDTEVARCRGKALPAVGWNLGLGCRSQQVSIFTCLGDTLAVRLEGTC